MSPNIFELIQQFCPDGVEYRRLGEVLTIRNGRDYKHLCEGAVPVYGSGGIMSHVDTAIYDKPSVLIPRKGSLHNLYYVEKPFWNVDTIFYTEINTLLMIPKYVFYWLQSQHLEKLNEAGGVPSLTQSMLNKVLIPVPPLPVQQEIVRILDTFDTYRNDVTAGLAGELAMRRKQFQYWQEKLLSFDDSVPRKALGDVVGVLDNLRKPISKSCRVQGSYPYYGANGIQDYVSDYLFDGTYVLVGEDGSVVDDDGHPFVNWVEGRIWVNNHAHIIVERNGVSLRYVFYCLQTLDISKLVRGNIPKLTGSDFKNLFIPIPPLSVQQEIVRILDVFVELERELERELELRAKQFEYYRDHLLAFPEKKGA